MKPLAKQGSLLQLLELEQTDLTWKSICYNMPKGLLSFALRASIDCLPTPENLSLWGKQTNDKCKLCGGRGSLMHILNSCPVALTQGRFTYRHNSVLSYMDKSLRSLAESNNIDVSIYSDLQGKGINGGTVPASIVPTTEKPDLVLHVHGDDSVYLVELTVPMEPNISKARARKESRYCNLVSDIKSSGHQCKFICI